uniref:uncharacterized protein LOC122776417 isoform X2 n=1 Tax=Solea senegalensis TaxID=28829 RepID=UPI001CD89F1D|nr:uncharacterized protein LOC122776417 isoform X2 [Solea senegalensis]
MDHVVFRGAVEQQHLQQLKQVAQDVIRPLMKGLHSFNHVSEMLLCIEPGVILRPESQCFHDIRQQIEKMNEKLQESQSIANTERRRIDGETEHLTAELSHLANQKSQTMSRLNDLKMTLNSHRSNLESYRASLELEKRNLQSAKNTRDNMRRRRDAAETTSAVGAGLFVIPIIGWIAGGIMLGVSAAEWNETNAAVDRATEEVDRCESQVDEYTDKVSEYSSRICQAECDITMADNKIHEIEANLRAVSVKREFVADVQEKIRHAVHQLGQLCVVGSVAEVQTRYMIVLEPVIQVFEEMTTALSRITGDELLHTEGIHSLMCDMKEKQGKLKQLVDSKRSLGD